MKTLITALLFVISFGAFADKTPLTVFSMDRTHFSMVTILEHPTKDKELGINFICERATGIVYPTFLEPVDSVNDAIVIRHFAIIVYKDDGEERSFTAFDSHGEGMFNLGGALRRMADTYQGGYFSVRLYDEQGRVAFETRKFSAYEFSRQYKAIDGCEMTEIAGREDWRQAMIIDIPEFAKYD